MRITPRSPASKVELFCVKVERSEAQKKRGALGVGVQRFVSFLM
tara:strand:- start:580 stop:711 length:132 start_codon:yes stop_codon:yes gene_type:complete